LLGRRAACGVDPFPRQGASPCLPHRHGDLRAGHPRRAPHAGLTVSA
jgi:hypothetical protein